MVCSLCAEPMVDGGPQGAPICPTHGTVIRQGTEDAATEEPTDPFTAFASAAIQMPHLFTSFMEGGFTEWQALRLVAAVVVESGRQS